MNILLLSSVMRDSDFSSYQTLAKIKPNPSNQNFYSKLVKTFAIKNNVSVVSKRPFTKGMFSETSIEADKFVERNVKFYYTRAGVGKFYKLLIEPKEIFDTAIKAIDDFKSDNFLIVVDTLKYSLLSCALKLRKKFNVPIVGMLTDNPENLSNANPSINKKIMKLGAKLNGYLSLTQGLANLYNKDLPSYVFEGLVNEENESKKDPIFNYFYFAGSLYEKYGVKDLVDAFCASGVKSKLVIAGSGPLENYIEEKAQEDHRILFLTQINKEKNFAYMKNALANINPRPTDKKLDNESIPSKLIEYLSVGVPVISTKHEKFYGPFKDDVLWINANGRDEIRISLEQFDVYKQDEYLKKAASARRKVFEFYGLSVQAESIDHFLHELISSNKR